MSGEPHAMLLSGRGDDTPGAPYSVTRTESEDIEQQAASLSAWRQVYAQLTPGRFEGTLDEASFRSVQVFREAMNQSIHQAGTGCGGSRAIGVPVAMHGTALWRGEPVDLGTMITLASGEELDLYAPPGFEVLALTVDQALLDDYAARVDDRDAGAAMRGRQALRPQPEELGALRRLLASMLQAIHANAAALRYEQTQRMLEQTLLNKLLDVVASGDDARDARGPCAGRKHVVEAARAYMSAHIDEPISVADLCLELGVSRRTLQYAFSEVLNLNPVRFLRALRLNGVRRELVADEAGSARVQDVAARWGFWHLGHFVTDYKAMFGELPSQTARRGKRAAP